MSINIKFYLSVITIFILLTKQLSAQTANSFEVVFHPIFNSQPLILENDIEQLNTMEINVEVLKFYLSNIKLLQDEKVVFEEENSVHLMDVANPESFYLSLDTPKEISFNQIKFNIGIDSLTNVSGAFGGDLDPSNGMYWTWQSGYINFKLEGTAKHCPTRHNRFQYHIGGYQAPYNSLQNVQLEIIHSRHINIDVTIDHLFNNIDIQSTNQIMSPNEQAISFAKLIPAIFTISK